MSGEPLISCLCVTHDRVPMLRRSVYCFLAQTHAARELVVLHESRDQATADFVTDLNHPMIRHVSVPSSPRLSLGAKRNLAVQAARGRYVATWDDDDWNAPTRLAEQLKAIRDSGQRACVLKHVVVCDTRTGQAWLSQGRNWDQTVLCEREAIPPYADVAEDVPCINALASRGEMVSLASPQLYVYAYHGGSAGTLAHFTDNVFSNGTRLASPLSRRIVQLLGAPHGKPPSLAEVLAAREKGMAGTSQATQPTPAPPLISCLCVTHDRVHMLRRSVGCFLAQTHPARELIILHEDVDSATREYVEALAHPMIRRLEVPSLPHIRLGAKRNLMVQASLGRYVATWDDDDWHAPTRLAEQLHVINESGAGACVLQHLVVHDALSGQSWLSQGRSWDQTVLAERAIMPPYADLDVGGDFPCVNLLAVRGQLAALDRAQLYIYVYHGANVGGPAHFMNDVFAHSTPLSAAASKRIAQVLESPQSRPFALAELLAGQAGPAP